MGWLQAAINGLPKEQRPEVLVSASAVGTSQVLHRPARIHLHQPLSPFTLSNNSSHPYGFTQTVLCGYCLLGICPVANAHFSVACHTIRFVSTSKVLAKRAPKHYRIS